MNIQVRDFNENDKEVVIEIHRLCRSAFKFEEITPEFICEISQRDDFKFIVAVIDDKTVGFAGALLYESLERAELGPLAVHPKFRNYGVGTKFVRCLLEFLQSKKIKTVTACVKSDNVNAVKFFEKFGFEFEEEFKDYMQSGGNIIQMVKYL